jgi:hypothetical protein
MEYVARLIRRTTRHLGPLHNTRLTPGYAATQLTSFKRLSATTQNKGFRMYQDRIRSIQRRRHIHQPAQNLDDVARTHPGRILFSLIGRWTLDVGCSPSRSVPVVQRIERGFPKAKRALLLMCARILSVSQTDISEQLATSSVSSAVSANVLILDARVTQIG